MTEILYTPIIQCAAVQRPFEAAYHQRWFLADRENQALSLEADKMATMQVEIRFGYLVLRAPGMLRLDIPMEVIEDEPEAFETAQLPDRTVQVVDEGELSQAWLSSYFGFTVKLLKVID